MKKILALAALPLFTLALAACDQQATDGSTDTTTTEMPSPTAIVPTTPEVTDTPSVDDAATNETPAAAPEGADAGNLVQPDAAATDAAEAAAAGVEGNGGVPVAAPTSPADPAAVAPAVPAAPAAN